MKLSFKVLEMTVGASLALAGSKTAGDLPPNPNQPVDVLVRYKNPPTKDELKQLGPYGQIKKIFSHVNVAVVSLTRTQIQALVASDPNIVYISPNRQSKGALDITTASVNANLAWSLGYDGTGVGVAVIDSGIALLDDVKTANGLSSRVVYSESFVDSQDGSDQYGHGTHVAGIVGSNAQDSMGSGFTRSFKGVAPNVNLINLRVLDSTGSGTDSGVIGAIERAIA
jgi:serine protease AprX